VALTFGRQGVCGTCGHDDDPVSLSYHRPHYRRSLSNYCTRRGSFAPEAHRRYHRDYPTVVLYVSPAHPRGEVLGRDMHRACTVHTGHQVVLYRYSGCPCPCTDTASCSPQIHASTDLRTDQCRPRQPHSFLREAEARNPILQSSIMPLHPRWRIQRPLVAVESIILHRLTTRCKQCANNASSGRCRHLPAWSPHPGRASRQPR
jgi:hypothetical protein